MNYQEMGKRMKCARETVGITQEELAHIIGCTTQHISALERGIKQPSLDTLVQIANALRVSADYLLSDILVVSDSAIGKQISLLLEGQAEDMQLRVLRSLRVFFDK